jgi:hypothetical protein
MFWPAGEAKPMPNEQRFRHPSLATGHAFLNRWMLDSSIHV